MTASTLAAKLADARRTLKFIDFDPAIACKDIAEAYAVQAEVARLIGADVAGWKVGLLPEGKGGWAAPIFGVSTIASGGTFHFKGDMDSVKVEAELGVRFARDLPPRPGKPYSREEVLDAVGAIFAGVELVGTRFRKGVQLPFATRLADGFANTAYTPGPDFKDFRSLDLSKIRCVLKQDGKIISDREGGHQQGDPMVPVVAWANVQADRFGGIKAGQYITTGTLTEPYDLDAAVTLENELVGIGKAVLKTAAG